jgi:dolichol-phosphate mannosyltransferase
MIGEIYMAEEQKISSVSVIMPTLNEAGNIANLIHRTVEELQKAGIQNIEIIVVDDDSQDRTWEIASRVVHPPAQIQVIRRMADHGLTASLSAGIEHASHDVVVWLDCDFSHPPECIPQMISKLDQGFDIVVNSRYVAGGKEYRVGKGGAIQIFLSTMLNWVVRYILSVSISDYTSGFIAVRKVVLEAVPLRGDYGEYFVDFIFRALHKNYKICELPYVAMPRLSGESKTGTHLLQYWRRGRKYLVTILRLRLDLLRGKL